MGTISQESYSTEVQGSISLSVLYGIHVLGCTVSTSLKKLKIKKTEGNIWMATSIDSVDQFYWMLIYFTKI